MSGSYSLQRCNRSKEVVIKECECSWLEPESGEFAATDLMLFELGMYSFRPMTTMLVIAEYPTRFALVPIPEIGQRQQHTWDLKWCGMQTSS